MAKAEKVKNTNVKMQEGFFYFLDKDGDISKTPRKGKGSKTKVKRVGIKRKPGFVYYLKDGDVYRSPMGS